MTLPENAEPTLSTSRRVRGIAKYGRLCFDVSFDISADVPREIADGVVFHDAFLEAQRNGQFRDASLRLNMAFRLIDKLCPDVLTAIVRNAPEFTEEE